MAVDRLLTQWADDAPASNVQDPGLAQELSGYGPDQELPRDEVNYILRQALNRQVPVFDDQRDAVEALPEGAIGVVFAPVVSGPPPDITPGHRFHKPFKADLGNHGNAVATDGDIVVFGDDDGHLHCFTPDGVELWSNTALPGAGAFNPRSLCVDGDAIYCFRGNNDVIKVDRLTGTVVAQDLATYSLLEAIISTGDYVYVCGADVDGAGATLARVDKSSLAIINSVTVDGATIMRDLSYYAGNLWVAHDRGTGNAVVSVYDDTLGAGPSGNRWANANADGRAIVATKWGVAVGLTTNAANGYNVVFLPLRGAAYAGTSPLWTGRFAAASQLPSVWDMDWDGDRVLVVATVQDATYGSFRAYDVANGSILEEIDFGAGLDARGIAADPWRVYVASEEVAAQWGAHFYNLSEEARLVRRVPGDSRYRARQHLLTL